MSIIRIVEGNYTTEIEGSWTVYTDEFNAYAAQGSHFTANEGIVFGNPASPKEEEDKTIHLDDGWWSTDKEGNERIREAKVGQNVYFNIRTKGTAIDTEIPVSIALYDHDPEEIDDPIEIHAQGLEGENLGILNKANLNKNGITTFPLTLTPGLDNIAEIAMNDEIQLFFRCSYLQDMFIALPKDPANYLLVHTCDKKVVKSYAKIGFGRCEFYQFRYNDFMRRHKDCGHVPPHYYYGPMLKMNSLTSRFYNVYALTKEMKSEAVGMDVSQIKMENRHGVEAKPLLFHSYGFKYCVRFTHVLEEKLSVQGKDWLTRARFRLQELMELGLIKFSYEAKYDKIIEILGSFFNKNFEPTEKESGENGGYKAAKKMKKKKYYRNIELNNKRFQEFAFATHPDAYDPKEMSELPIKDLALIALSPDFKEWIGAGSYGTWLQAAIVAANMDYQKLYEENKKHYGEEDNSIVHDAWIVLHEGAVKAVKEASFLALKETKAINLFVALNTINNEN